MRFDIWTYQCIYCQHSSFHLSITYICKMGLPFKWLYSKLLCSACSVGCLCIPILLPCVNSVAALSIATKLYESLWNLTNLLLSSYSADNGLMFPNIWNRKAISLILQIAPLNVKNKQQLKVKVRPCLSTVYRKAKQNYLIQVICFFRTMRLCLNEIPMTMSQATKALLCT